MRATAFALALSAGLASSVQAQESAPSRATWNDFPVFVWRQDRGAQELEPKFANAFKATNLMRGEDSLPLAKAALAFYIDNAAGRNELHLDRDKAYEKRWEKWYETRDAALLIRQPCLNDPALRGRLRATLENTLADHKSDLGLGLSLGDEVSWTPYGSPEDTCLCDHCKAAWRAFLERAIEAGRSHLSADFDLANASTDAARLALEEGGAQTIHAWLLRREFTQASMQSLLLELSARAKELRPEVSLGLLGMIGRSAFGGVAIDRVLPQLRFAESYRVSDAREMLFTLRAPGQRVIQTIFFDDQLPGSSTWFAWESWMRGADGLVVWSDRELRAHPEYAQSMALASARIRELRAREPRFAPRPTGVAIVNDENSIAYGWLCDARLDGPTWPKRLQGWQEERGSREKSLRAWLRVLEDCGAMPGAIALDQVGANSARRFPLLILNHLRVLDPQGAVRLQEFLQAGGTVAIRGDLGRIDAFGNPPARAWIELLREKNAANVIEIGEELDAYPSERINGGFALRAQVSALLARAHVPIAPWRMTNAGAALPWLSTWTELSDGSVLGAAIPNLAEAPERLELVDVRSSAPHPRLFEVKARLELPAAFEVQWLNPAGAEGRDCTLAAGEAAVFRLVK